MRPAAVICEIMDEDGQMARRPSLERFSARHEIPIISTAALIDWILTTEGNRRGEPSPEKIIRPVIDIRLPTSTGPFRLYAYKDTSRPVAAEPHLALVAGDPRGFEPVLARIHSECLTGDAFGSSRCDCGQQLDLAMEQVADRGRGVILYLRQEGRGIGLVNKLRAYELQDAGWDTVEANHQLGFPADLRDYRAAAEILLELGVSRVELLTNNPHKISSLANWGIEVVGRTPLSVAPATNNRRYLDTKRAKLGHLIAD
jgi:3,4-dihydroxy 2-butanone 4-phosphate synthase/GTP cyclohydrolase II